MPACGGAVETIDGSGEYDRPRAVSGGPGSLVRAMGPRELARALAGSWMLPLGRGPTRPEPRVICRATEDA